MLRLDEKQVEQDHDLALKNALDINKNHMKKIEDLLSKEDKSNKSICEMLNKVKRIIDITNKFIDCRKKILEKLGVNTKKILE